MADDHVPVDEHFQVAGQGAEPTELGVGSAETDINDIDNKDERVSPAPVDVFL